MRYTSSEANKLLKKLNSDYASLKIIESERKTFLAASGEDPESVRPEYDYENISDRLQALCLKIRTLKHAINVFNTTTSVEGFDMTIDEMLVALPQLYERVATLDSMRNAAPKARERSYGSGINATIDYRYVNYDIEKAAKDYEESYELLSRMQTALDITNNTLTMEIDI